jgi:hypothetical protein
MKTAVHKATMSTLRHTISAIKPVVQIRELIGCLRGTAIE